jgi:hypothetical protein
MKLFILVPMILSFMAGMMCMLVAMLWMMWA